MISLSQQKYTKDFSAQDLRDHHKLEYVHKFQQQLINNPKLPKTVLCDKAGISNSTLKRYMKDLGLKSFYRHDHKINRQKPVKGETLSKSPVDTKSTVDRLPNIRRKVGGNTDNIPRFDDMSEEDKIEALKKM